MRTLLASLLLFLATIASAAEAVIPAETTRAALAKLSPDPAFDALLKKVVLQAVAEAGDGKVAERETWAAAIDLRDPAAPRMASWQGSEAVYPASVVKLCYMVNAFAQMQAGTLADSPELREDLRLMIQPSDNKATNRILDRLTGAESGPELPPAEMAAWEEKRHTVVRYLESIGLPGLYATNKTFDGSIPLMGRDKARLGGPKGDNFEKSNMLTADDTARLLYLIRNRSVVSERACAEMLELLQRTSDGPRGTIRPGALPAGTVLRGKYGNTSICRHDAAIVELPGGGAVVAVFFTKARGARESDFPAVPERACQLLIEAMVPPAGSAALTRFPGS